MQESYRQRQNVFHYGFEVVLAEYQKVEECLRCEIDDEAQEQVPAHG